MDKDFVEKMLALLLKERETIRSSLDAGATNIKSLISNTEAGDEVDVASDAVDRMLLDSLSAQDAQRLAQIDGAITRIRQGNYGVCAKCGKDIPQARLKALPYAVMCIRCASKK